MASKVNKLRQVKPKQKPSIPDAQQSESAVQKQGSKLFGKLPFGAGVVYVLITSILLLTLVLVGSSALPKSRSPKESPPTPNPEIPAAAGPGLRLPIEQQLAESGVEQLLDDVYAGKIKTDTTSEDYGFDVGEKENDWITLRIIVHPYIPGKKITEGYENSPTWERSFDKEVELFSNLRPGKQVATVYDTTISPDVVEINFRKIGDRYFAVYHTSFAPSSTTARHYFTYDKANRQLIYIYAIVDFYAVRKSLTETADGQHAYYKYEDVVYPENFQKFLDELEKLL